MKKKQIKAIISDFDGVLCRDYFYHTLESKRPELYEIINTKLFRENKPLIKSWMRNELSSEDINKFLADLTSEPINLFSTELNSSVQNMKLNQKLVNFVKKAKKKGIRTAVLTDNMDVFRDVFVPTHQLDKIFEIIVSSHEYGILKGDDNGKLLDLTRELLGLEFENILILDDWPKIEEFAMQKNSNFYLYNRETEDNFSDWFDKNFYF